MLNIKNLGTRTATGILFVLALLSGILFNQYLFLCVFSVILILALHEFYRLIDKSAGVSTSQSLNVVGGLLLFIGSYLFFSSTISSFVVFTPYILYVLVLFISELYLKRTDPIRSLAYSALGQIYLALPLSLLNYLVFIPNTATYRPTLLLGLFIFIWVNDSFAYLTGSLFGKHRMFERISPKKSWEGFAGGVAFTIGAAIIYAHFYPQFGVAEWIGYSLITIVFGTLGDLIESLLKRTLNVKDSGNILPGHGGILDRIDSVVFAIPAQFVYIQLLYFFFH